MNQAVEQEIEEEHIEEVDQLEEGSQEQNEEDQSPEERAARMGWKPQDEYKGNDEWVPAEDFIKKVEEETPYLKKALRAIERKYEKLEKTTEAIHAHTQRQIEAAEKQAYEKALKEVQDEMAQAVEAGDVEAVNKALEKRDKVVSQPKSDPNVEIVNQWKANNEWFGNDPALTQAAAAYTDILAQQGKSVQEQLEGAEAYIKETFPHKFKEDKRTPRKAPVMNGGGNNVNKGAPKKGTYEALDQQSRAECDRFVRDITARTGKSEKAARAEWLKFATDDMFK